MARNAPTVVQFDPDWDDEDIFDEAPDPFEDLDDNCDLEEFEENRRRRIAEANEY